jgi:LysM repeat protein
MGQGYQPRQITENSDGAAAAAVGPASTQLRGNSFAKDQLADAKPGGKTHTVVRGDTLSGIARDEMGDIGRWPELYDANRDVVGSNPDLIYPGQILQIPGGSGGPAAGNACVPVPNDLQSSPDLASMTDDELDERLARIDDLLVQRDDLAPEDLAALEQQRADLMAEKTGRAAFEQVTSDDMAKSDAPDELILPPALVEGMQTAWDGSLPGGHSKEQGGILVRNADGSYEWKAGTESTAGTFTPNFGDKEADEDLLATGHSHPYDATESGHEDVSFSGGDLANLVVQPVRLKAVQSGAGTFVVTKTEEFDVMVDALDTAGRETLQQDMKDLWNTTFRATSGSFQERVEAAVEAVCETYHLIYYSGGGNTVQRVDGSP